LQNLDGVLESIANALMEGPLTPALSRKGRE